MKAAAVLVAFALMCGCASETYPYYPGRNLSAVFFDVGQGDSSLILFPDGRKIMLDCGEFDDAAGYLRRMNITWIDVLIITHPDADHEGGCKYVMEEAEIGKVITNSNVDSDFLLKISPYAYAEAIVAYDSKGRFEGDNDNSVVLKIGYGNASFLFMGDCENECEKELAKSSDVKAGVLKAGHHGSKHSSTLEFLEKVEPSIVIVSAGAGNQYGHPHEDTLERIKWINATVHRTDEEGNVIVSTDGNSYHVG